MLGQAKDQTMFGEIKGDGMIIHDKETIDEEIINEMVDRESNEIQNQIIVKTMRCRVSDVLGAEMTMEILECMESAPAEFYETPVVRYLDFLWERHGRKAVAFNCIYIAYPLILSLLTITSQNDLYENRIFGLIMTILLILIEMYQMHLGGI